MPPLIIAVQSQERVQLRNGRTYVILRLSCSYRELLARMREISSNRTVGVRLRGDREGRSVRATIDLVAPMDAPASLTIEAEHVDDALFAALSIELVGL